MRKIIGWVSLVLLLVGLIWGFVGIVQGFAHPSFNIDKISSFDLAIYVFGFSLGISYWSLSKVKVKRNIWIAIAALIINVALSYVLKENASELTTSPLIYYLSFFFPQFLTSFIFGLFI